MSPQNLVEVEGPVGGSCDSTAFGSHAQQVQFNWQQPWNSLEATAEEKVVAKEERDRGRSHFPLVGLPFLLGKVDQYYN
jgi:hypothetical protein